MSKMLIYKPASIALSQRLESKKIRFFMELLRALQISWIIGSIAILSVSLGWIIFGDNFLADLGQILQSDHSKRECFFCGMTEAFLKIRIADFFGALKANENSLIVFFSLLSNQIGFILFLAKTCRVR